MISRQKLKLIHVGRRELGLSEEEYREILRHHAGVASARDLDDLGFKRVIDHFKAIGFWIKRNWEQSRPRDAGDLPTPDQLRVIRHLWEDLAQYIEGARHEKFRQGFYGRRLHISPLGPQTRAQANHAIEVLKQRVRQEGRKVVQGSRFKPLGAGPRACPPG